MNGIIYEQEKTRGYMGADTSEENKRELIQREMGVFVTATRSGFTMLLLFALLLNYSNAFHDILPMCK